MYRAQADKTTRTNIKQTTATRYRAVTTNKIRLDGRSTSHQRSLIKVTVTAT